MSDGANNNCDGGGGCHSPGKSCLENLGCNSNHGHNAFFSSRNNTPLTYTELADGRSDDASSGNVRGVMSIDAKLVTIQKQEQGGTESCLQRQAQPDVDLVSGNFGQSLVIQPSFHSVTRMEAEKQAASLQPQGAVEHVLPGKREFQSQLQPVEVSVEVSEEDSSAAPSKCQDLATAVIVSSPAVSEILVSCTPGDRCGVRQHCNAAAAGAVGPAGLQLVVQHCGATTNTSAVRRAIPWRSTRCRTSTGGNSNRTGFDAGSALTDGQFEVHGAEGAGAAFSQAELEEGGPPFTVQVCPAPTGAELILIQGEASGLSAPGWTAALAITDCQAAPTVNGSATSICAADTFSGINSLIAQSQLDRDSVGENK